MYPNQPQAPGTPPQPEQPPQQQPAQPVMPQSPLPQPSAPNVDYLNQIAPKKPKKLRFKFGPKMIAILGGILVVVVIIISITVNVIANARREPVEHLSARLTTTQEIVSDAQDNLKSSQLRSLNSNLKIYLTNTNRDIATPLANVGVKPDKISKSILAEESGDALTAKLEDARLNVDYDRTYAREMAYKLEQTMILMQQIYKSTSSKSLKSFLENAYTNLEPTQKSFADFNAANG